MGRAKKRQALAEHHATAEGATHTQFHAALLESMGVKGTTLPSLPRTKLTAPAEQGSQSRTRATDRRAGASVTRHAGGAAGDGRQAVDGSERAGGATGAGGSGRCRSSRS